MQVRTVLCPVDFTPLSERGVELAVRVAGKFGARLVLEHNVDSRPPGYLGVSWMWSEEHEQQGDGVEADAERRLRRALNALPASLRPEAKLTRGPLEESLLQAAQIVAADLMVMASHGSDLEHRSLTERILRQAPCPLLTLAEGAEPGDLLAGDALEPLLLVPCDLSPQGMGAARQAVELAGLLPARLVFLHVEAPSSGERSLAAETAGRSERLERFESEMEALVPEALRERLECRIESGWPTETILRCCREVGAGLMVLGVHRKGPLQRALAGATAIEVMHRSPCPVWFVPCN